MASFITNDPFILMAREKVVEIQSRDEQILEECGITSKQVAEILCRIVQKAQTIYTNIFGEALPEQNLPNDPFSLKFRRPSIELDETIKVSGLDFRKNRWDRCLLCGHEVSWPVVYCIENKKTGEKIEFLESVLHFITDHGFFGEPGHLRLDPLTASRVLNLLRFDFQDSHVD